MLLEVKNVCKSVRSDWLLKPKILVRDLTFSLNEGESFGFLGHNGAGKTTSLKCLAGITKPTSGTIRFDGRDIADKEVRKQLGFLPELPYFYDHLTVQETLLFFAQLIKVPADRVNSKLDELRDLLRLQDEWEKPVRSLSKGTQQRLGLAQAIIGEPRLLILDEPFSGLDPIGRALFKDIFSSLNRRGTTLLISSHILSDVEELCSRVSIMVKGEVRCIYDLKGSRSISDERYNVIFEQGSCELPAQIKNFPAIVYREQTNTFGCHHIFQLSSYEAALELVKKGLESNLTLFQFERQRPSLEELFIKVTKGVQGTI